jgi:hypothetical protein
MKLKFKMAAVAAALASLAGGAHADLTTGTTQNNGSFSLLALNVVTNDWYIRDLGFLMNSFLPTGITTSVADNNQGLAAGPNPAAVGDKSPEAGLLLNGSNTANFSDPSFATWLATQDNANVRWMVGSYDLQSVSSTQNSRRLIASSTNAAEDFTNAQLDSFTSTGQWGVLGNYFNPGLSDLSVTGVAMQGSAALNAFASGIGFATVGQSANLFYAVRSTFTGSTTAFANTTAYGNSGGLATVTLEADGDFIYSLAPAGVAPVPLPPALWLMGAGLVAMGGMVRRRRAAAALQA